MASLLQEMGIIKVGLALLLPLVVLRTLMGKKRKSSKEFLKGKVVWVTGASSGLGEQIALAAAQADVEGLILSGRKENLLQQVKAACLAKNASLADKAVAIVPFDLGDVTEGGVVSKGIEAALKTFGRVDILVNNAGVSTRAPSLSTSLAVERSVMDVNYFSPVALAKGVLPGMLERRCGNIILINSVQGLFGISSRTTYAASKHALRGFFDSLRAEVASRGVKVTSVYPGYIATNLSVNAVTGDGSKHGVMDATTASGYDPAVVARDIWQGVASGEEEMLVCEQKVKVAVLLRTLFPRMLFKIMAKRALKEEKAAAAEQ